MHYLSKLRTIYIRHPILRGVAAYGVLWPMSSIIQQGMKDISEPINWPRAIRFGVIGSLYVAPLLYFWVRFTSRVFPGKDIKTAIKKALIEQVTYGPCALSGIFFGLSALEGKRLPECVDEVKQKFWPTFKVGVCVWPVIQTVNYYFVPEKNRVVYVSVMSVLWTCFLSHMKSLSKEEIQHHKQH